jgi:CheY-like chemotaxis protein
VLCVDDNVEVGKFLQELLEDWSLEVTCFKDSAAAHAPCATDPTRYDFVVLDQTMLQMTGLELARALLERRPAQPGVLTTGYSDQVNEETVKVAGVRAMLK